MTQEEQTVSQLTLAKYATDIDATINQLESALNTLEKLGVEAQHKKLLEAVSNRITFLLELGMNEWTSKALLETQHGPL